MSLPALRLQGEGERWVTSAELVGTGQFKRQAIAWNCSQGDLKHCHRWIDNPRGGPKILEIDLNAPTCPKRYRRAMEKPGEGNQEFGEAHALTTRQLAKATQIASLLEEVEELIRTPAPGMRERDRIKAFLAIKGKPLSIASYYRQKQRWIEGGRTLHALADGRAVPGGGVKVEFEEDALVFFASIYLTQECRRKVICYDKLKEEAREKGWSVPSLATVLRSLNERYPKDKQRQLREGDKAYRDRAQAHLLRSREQMKWNQCWVSDHCLLDVIGIDDLPGASDDEIGRPCRMWVTTWMCEATGYIVSLRVHRKPNTRQVMASFFNAIVREGLPDHIRIDNGKEYRCWRFAGGRDWREEVSRIEVDESAIRPLLFDLKITPHYANPYNARAKIIEPWHRNCIKEHFSKFVPGYCGGNSQEKPEQLAAIVRHWQKTGDGLMPWSKLVELLAQVIDGHHREGKPSLGGHCPAFLRQQKRAQVSIRNVDERTAALFMEPREATITGGLLKIDGFHFGLGNMELITRQGEKVIARLDEMNAGRVYVFELNGRYITTAYNQGLVDQHATREDLEKHSKEVAAHNKLKKKWEESQGRIVAIDPHRLIGLRSTKGAPQALPAGSAADEPGGFKIDFSPRADDGSLLLPASPAPEAPECVQVDQGTDSPESQPGSGFSLKNPLDLLSDG